MSATAQKAVLSVLAHPDDAEFMCAGTLALLRQRGWAVHIATMTPGDCGSARCSRDDISRQRRQEATRAAAMLEGDYHCLEGEDVFIMYDRPTLLKVIALVRQVRPRLVLAPSPQDYFVDHENTSRLVWTACFASSIRNVETPGAEPLEATPHLYYGDALEGKDLFGQPVAPSLLVDISGVMDVKERMLCCHESQREWLMAHHGIDEYVGAMRQFAGERGRRAGCAFAEGFRQHRGEGFPQDDLLRAELGTLVKTTE